MNRLEFLQQIGATAIGSALGAASVMLRQQWNEALPANSDTPILPSSTEAFNNLNNLLSEIERFETLMTGASLQLSSAVAVPFASLPMNRYMRLSPELLKLPAPKIEPLLTALRADDHTAFRAIMRALIDSRLQGYKPVRFEDVNWADFRNDGRIIKVVSPQHTVDMDDGRAFNCHGLAELMINSARGISEEVIRQRAQDAAVFNCFEHMSADAYVRREAYMLTAFSWVTLLARKQTFSA